MTDPPPPPAAADNASASGAAIRLLAFAYIAVFSAEALSQSGFAFLSLDMEHSPRTSHGS